MKHTDETKAKCAEAARNQVHTKESRRKHSESISGEKNYFFGQAHTEETKKKLSDANKGLHEGEKNAFYGKKHTDECKEVMRLLKLGTKASAETKAKLSAMRKGEGNSMFGKTHKPESIKKMSIPVFQYTKDYIFVREWASGTEAARVLGFSSAGNISSCARGNMGHAYGYLWRYEKLNNKNNTNIN